MSDDMAAEIQRAFQQQGAAQNAYCQPVEKDGGFVSRMMASLGQEQTTLRKADYLRLCQMAAKGL